MSSARSRTTSIFSGVVLVLVGGLLLLHSYYPDFPIGALFFRWWPTLLIVWGLLKLYEHMAAKSGGDASAGHVSGGEVLLVLGLLLLLAIVAGADWVRVHKGDWDIPDISVLRGTPYSFTEEVPARTVSAAPQISIAWSRGDINVIPEDTPQIRVLEKKTAYADSQDDAESAAGRIHATVTEKGNGSYEIRPSGGAGGDRVQVDIEVHVPKQSSLSVSTDRGGARISGILGSVSVQTRNGDTDVRESGGDVSVSSAHGDVHVVGVAGDVKVSGRGSEVEIADIQGQVALAGEFFGPIHMSRVKKGVRFASRQTDLTLTQLSGRLEAGSGNIEISDTQGDMSLIARKSDVNIENPGGRVQITDDGGDVGLHYPQPPRADISVQSRSGDLSVSLPPQSNFELDAQTQNGDLNCDFPTLTSLGKPDGDNQKLTGRVGDHGPTIQLRTQHGDIRISKKSS